MNDKELWKLISIICEGQDSEQRRKVEQYITYLQKEIERLNNIIERLNNIIFNQNKRNSHQRIANDNLQNKNIKLNNIINELEKWCLSWKENDKYCYLASNDKDKCRYDIWEEVLDKLQELKGSEKE